MMKKLMTWKRFEEKFKPDSNWWDEYRNGDIHIEYNGVDWWIVPIMKELFGTYIEVEKLDGINYTHYGINNDIFNNFYWNELWFEEYEFLTEKDIIIK